MTKEEKNLHEIYDKKKETYREILEEEFSDEKRKKFLIEELENSLATLRINEWNIKKYFGEFNILNKNVWYTWEMAQACIKDLLVFINNKQEK